MKPEMLLVQFTQSFSIIGTILHPFGSAACGSMIANDYDFFCEVKPENRDEFDKLIKKLNGERFKSKYGNDQLTLECYRFSIIGLKRIEICVVSDAELKQKTWEEVKQFISHLPKQFRTKIWNLFYKLLQ